MGSPLGPDLANIFAEYYQEKPFSEIFKPAYSISDMLMSFLSSFKMKESVEFLIQLNGLYSSLQFNFEKKKNNSVPFHEVHGESTKVSYETKGYRKPMFTGQWPVRMLGTLCFNKM